MRGPAVVRRIAARERVRLHLARTHAALLRRARPDLPPDLKEERARNLARLGAYWRRGRFPVNRTRPGRAPVFRDEAGTCCAVGHLALLAGRGDIVDAIGGSDNHVRLSDVHDGPIVGWLDHAGLTLEEARRIQPNYDYDPPREAPSPPGQPPQQPPPSEPGTVIVGIEWAVGAVMVAALVFAYFWLPALGRLERWATVGALAAAGLTAWIVWALPYARGFHGPTAEAAALAVAGGYAAAVAVLAVRAGATPA